MPLARERAKKMQFISWLLWNKWNLGNRELTQPVLRTIIEESGSYDRVWRKVLQDCPNLRGSDYEDKKALSENTQIALGYETGYIGNGKKLKTL